MSLIHKTRVLITVRFYRKWCKLSISKSSSRTAKMSKIHKFFNKTRIIQHKIRTTFKIIFLPSLNKSSIIVLIMRVIIFRNKYQFHKISKLYQIMLLKFLMNFYSHNSKVITKIKISWNSQTIKIHPLVKIKTWVIKIKILGIIKFNRTWNTK